MISYADNLKRDEEDRAILADKTNSYIDRALAAGRLNDPASWSHEKLRRATDTPDNEPF